MEVGGYQGSPRVDIKSPGKLMTDGLFCDETVLNHIPGDGDIPICVKCHRTGHKGRSQFYCLSI